MTFTIEGESPSHDVFISHSTRSKKDKEIARAIYEALKARGIRCWMAPHDIPAGMKWEEAIVLGLSECRVMVLVYTARSNNSPHVAKEVRLADKKGLAIVPFRIEDVPFSPILEYNLDNLQWLDATTEPLEQHIPKLTVTIEGLLRQGTAPLPDPLAPSPRPPVRSRRRPSLGKRLRKNWFWIASGVCGASAIGSVFWTLANPAPEGMVLVPAGTVTLGASEERLRAHANTLPVFKGRAEFKEDFIEKCLKQPRGVVHVGAFWIDKYEVTNAQYAAFTKASGHVAPSHWTDGRPPAGKEEHPVTHVRYSDASAYAVWARKQLPTAAQWTRAFRGDDDRMYPWGDNWVADRANVTENTAFDTGTSPVQASPLDVSPFGVFNLAGNVSEILRDRKTIDDEQAATVKGAHSLSRGTIYAAAPLSVYIVGDGTSDELVGFRCVIERK